jgi:hypothetical protein
MRYHYLKKRNLNFVLHRLSTERHVNHKSDLRTYDEIPNFGYLGDSQRAINIESQGSSISTDLTTITVLRST